MEAEYHVTSHRKMGNDLPKISFDVLKEGEG